MSTPKTPPERVPVRKEGERVIEERQQPGRRIDHDDVQITEQGSKDGPGKDMPRPPKR